jgi:hypothetical protein
MPHGYTRSEAMMFQAAFELAVNGLYMTHPSPPDVVTLARGLWGSSSRRPPSPQQIQRQ